MASFLFERMRRAAHPKPPKTLAPVSKATSTAGVDGGDNFARLSKTSLMYPMGYVDIFFGGRHRHRLSHRSLRNGGSPSVDMPTRKSCFPNG